MRIKVNGKEQDMEAQLTLAQLLEKFGGAGPGTAVAVNADVVKKESYAALALKDGDQVEIIHAVGGG
jgi:sulfur carrier protein